MHTLNFNHLLRNFQRLDPGAKLVFLGTSLAAVFVFLPWFQIDQPGEDVMRVTWIPETSNGLEIFPVFGFLSLVFIAGTLLYFTQYCLGEKKTFGLSHGKAWMILGGQALFMLFIALSVFFSETQTDSTAQIRFGVFGSVIAFGLVFFGGYVYERGREEEEARQAFSAPFSSELNHLNIRPEEPSVSTDQLSLSDVNERKQSILR